MRRLRSFVAARVAVVFGWLVLPGVVVLFLVVGGGLLAQVFLGQRLALLLGARRRDLRRDLGFAFFFFCHALHGDHLLVGLEADEAHALRVAADGRDPRHRHADQL